jgi:hypothetical protein
MGGLGPSSVLFGRPLAPGDPSRAYGVIEIGAGCPRTDPWLGLISSAYVELHPPIDLSSTRSAACVPIAFALLLVPTTSWRVPRRSEPGRRFGEAMARGPSLRHQHPGG